MIKKLVVCSQCELVQQDLPCLLVELILNCNHPANKRRQDLEVICEVANERLVSKKDRFAEGTPVH